VRPELQARAAPEEASALRVRSAEPVLLHDMFRVLPPARRAQETHDTAAQRQRLYGGTVTWGALVVWGRNIFLQPTVACQAIDRRVVILQWGFPKLPFFFVFDVLFVDHLPTGAVVKYV